MKGRVRNKVCCIGGAFVSFFALAPFPLGLGMIFPIADMVRGHPEGSHGTHPQNFVGFWIREETVMYDFVGQAFYLMPDGRLAGMTGMTERRWHFDDGRLFVDAVSRCGNCYQGNVTSEYTVRFANSDQMVVTNRDRAAKRGIAGVYRRVEINDALKSEMARQQESKNDVESFKGRTVLRAIERYEILSKLKG